MNMYLYHLTYRTEYARMIKLGHPVAFSAISAQRQAQKHLIVGGK